MAKRKDQSIVYDKLSPTAFARVWKIIQDRAQELKTYPIDGTDMPRIAWGSEPFDPELGVNRPDTGKPWADEDCGDCGVTRGQLHVHICDIERCPKCDWQWLSCEHGEAYRERLDTQDAVPLTIGMRVQATDGALKQGIVELPHITGVVVGFGKRKGNESPDLPRVLRDGLTQPLTYNRDWWEPIIAK